MTTDRTTIPPGGWKVGPQTVGYERAANGIPVKGVVVSFTTSGGTVSTVFVPQSTYTPAKVIAAIAAKVRDIETIEQSGTQPRR